LTMFWPHLILNEKRIVAKRKGIRMFKQSVSFLLLAVLAAPAFAALDGNTVAEINGRALTRDDFDRRYKENISFFKYEIPTKANILNDIINFEIAVQEARKMGLDKDPQVQEKMNAVLYQSLIERQLAEKFKGAVDVSEKEARDFCRRNPAVRFNHVYVALKPVSLKAEQEAARKKISEAQAAIGKGTPFEKVVAQYSEGFSAASAGDTGYVTKVQIDPALYMEARKLKVGEVSRAPVRSQMGLHLVKLSGVQDCGKIDIPEWQRMVFDEKRAKIFRDYLSELRSKAKVSINNELIKE
jgi:peptidyl-prolyl cis-trans isomerase C